VRNGSSVGRGVVGAGVGLFAGSAFSIRGGLGVAVGDSPFFFGVGDLSGFGVGLFLDLAFLDLGEGDLPGAGVGLFFFLPGVGVGSGVSSAAVETSSSSPVFFGEAFDLGAGDSSASPGLFVAFGVLVDSGVDVGVAFALAFGVGVGAGVFFVAGFDFRWAGFGFALGEGVTDGVGEETARISSRAFFFFSSSVDCARTSVPAIAPRASAVPRKTRSRITAGERNKAEGVINSRKISESRGLGHCLLGGRARGGAFPFPPQNRV
jgi:hypothetical protein